jgi:hypothetical protein
MELGVVFRRIAEALRAADVPYMLTGSFASSYFGALRSTQDIDIVIAASTAQVSLLVQSLQANDYYADQKAALDAHREQSMFNAIDNQTGWKIDFIFRKSNAYSQEAFQRRKSVQFQGAQMFVASSEDVIISKLDWAKMGESTRQIEDVAAVLKKQHQVVDSAYIEKWIKELGLDTQWAHARQIAGLE